MKKKTATAVHQVRRVERALNKSKREGKIATSFRLSENSYAIMRMISEQLGIPRGAVAEMAFHSLRYWLVETQKQILKDKQFLATVRKAAERGAK